jgi:hypothetical protein
MDQKTRKNGIRANEKEGEGGRGKGSELFKISKNI